MTSKRKLHLKLLEAVSKILGMSGLFWCALLFGAEEKKITIDFEPVPDASAYQIELTNSANKIQTFDLKTTTIELPLPVDTYKIRVRSFDARKVPGPWSGYSEVLAPGSPPELKSPAENEKINSSETDKEEVTFKWTPQELATRYKILIEPIHLQKETSDTSIEIELPVAATYKWRIISLKGEMVLNEDLAKWNTFTLYGKILDSPLITELTSKYDQVIQWTKPAFTQIFHVRIERDTDKGWRKVFEDEAYAESRFPIPKKYLGGEYKIRIKAKGELRPDSEEAEYKFNLASARGVVAAKKAELRDSLELPNANYVIASYLISNIQYSGINKETNSETVYNALGGTGRIGFGHFKQSSVFGYFGILDLSGFNIGQQNFTYASSEFHYGHRAYFATTQLRSSLGLYYKEIPETKGEIDGSYSMSKIAALGPHIGFDYWKPFTSQYGLQINARLYYSAAAAKTPNNRPLDGRMSYQMGVLGSYRFHTSGLAYLGYAYRLDEMAYKATPGTLDPGFTSVATEGDKNSVKLQGHFINAQLEWGF